jgi:hypothetical protein
MDDNLVISFDEYHRLPKDAVTTHYHIGRPSVFDLSVFDPNIQQDVFDPFFILNKFVRPFLITDTSDLAVKACWVLDGLVRFGLIQLLSPMGLQFSCYGGTSKSLYLDGMSQNQLRDVNYLTTIAKSLAQWSEKTMNILSASIYCESVV